MSLPDQALGTLTDRELLILIYGEISTISEMTNDHEARIRILEADRNRTLGIMAATGGGSGALGGGVVAIVLKLLGGC
ncbi:MAG: hypothetical protein GX885_11650 [Methanomicrobiales archaeon]|nr:hypothetical protein [Methanomicrobiales archaeon]